MTSAAPPSDHEESPARAGPAGHVRVDPGVMIEQVLDHAIISLDLDGTIESWNTGAERLKGHTHEQAIGRNFSMFYPATDVADRLPQRLLARAAVDGSVEHTGWRLRRDGSRFWGDVIITALHDVDGTLTGFVKVTRDLSPRKRLEDAQDSFFAAFAHDFKTPLTAVKAFSGLLRDATDPRRDTYLDRLDHNADELLRMVTDLLSYASTRAEHADLRFTELDVSALARETAAGLSSILDVDRLELPARTIMVIADRGAMIRVLENLVTNALKYSTVGPVTVRTETAGAWVRITVSDQGRGIAPDDLRLVFEEFERGRLATDDGGTGLGLASVRSLVRQQGGRVWIESAVDRGTTVTVELPSPGHLPPAVPGAA